MFFFLFIANTILKSLYWHSAIQNRSIPLYSNTLSHIPQIMEYYIYLEVIIMKQKLIKKISLFLLFLTVFSSVLLGCSTDSTQENNGTKGTATTAGYGGDVTVNVVVSGTNISKVDVDAPGETATIGGEAATQIAEEIVSKQSLAIDAISGATITSTAVLKAAEEALKNAGMDTSTLK